MPRFKVGDKVTIRQWEDMEKEYWIDAGWCIPVPRFFTPTMKKYSWNTYTIKNTHRDYYVLDWIHYDFSDEMFEESKVSTTKPKYWVVKKDESNQLYKKCIAYINEKSGEHWKGNYNFYWFDWSDRFNWYECFDTLESFKNNPQLITTEEWNKWFGSEVEYTYEESIPKYWMIENNPKHPLHDKFIRYMNLKCWNVNKNYYTWDWEYYWFDGGSYNNWYVCVSRPDYFENNPVLITLEEWDKWFGSEVSSYVKPEFKVWDRVYIKWCPWKFWVIVSISWITMSHCVKLDSWTEFFLNKEDLVKCEVDTTATDVCSDIWTTLTQETLQNAIDKLSVSTTIPQKTATSYIKLYDLYNKILGSWPTEAEEEPTSIFTFKKLK